jgi:Leucine-rich repeat (LRR) protein
LSLLRDLDASSNNLSSLDSLSPFKELAALQVLNLSGNYLVKIPPEIGNLPALEKLYVSENELIEVPPEMGNLTTLLELNLDENKLVTLPRTVGQMRSLEVLHINQNLLRDLPDEIYLLPLKMFGIDDNPFDDIPPNITDAGSQEVFDYLGQRLQNARAAGDGGQGGADDGDDDN